MLRSGRPLRARLFDVRQLESSLGHVRVAIVVPKFGNAAVHRNRLKRRLREITRQHLLPRSASCDVLLRARRDTYNASFEQLQQDLVRLAEQIG